MPENEDKDLFFMREALKEAEKALETGNWGEFYRNSDPTREYCFGLAVLAALPSPIAGTHTNCPSYALSKTNFRRSATLTKPNDDSIELTITVSWNVADPANIRSITVKHWLKNWN